MLGRWRLLGLVLGIAVGSAAIGWFAGRWIESPNDAGSDAEPPEASLVTVPVESRVLGSNVVVRGDVRFSESTELTVDVGSGVDSPVVTGQLPQPGDDLDEGDVALEVAGRPVLVLQGELPMFRSMAPGTTGDDVRQLEEALERLGQDPGEVDGTYDAGTQAAVRGWYEASGYAPLGLSEDERQQLEQAEDQVAQLRVGLRDAEAALAEAQQGATESQRLGAEAGVSSARRLLDEARASADATNAAAQAAVNSAVAARDVAAARLAQAEAGTHPDTGQPPTPAELTVLRDEVAAAQAAVNAAVAERTAVGRQNESAVADATEQLNIAVATRDELLAPPDITFQQRALEVARDALTEAEETYADLEFEFGTPVPKSEVVFLPLLPRRVDRVMVDRGDEVSGAVMSISGVELLVDSAVSAADRPLLSVGDQVVIDEQGLGIELEGQVVELADRPGTNGVAESRYWMQVAPDEGDPAELQGLNVRVTIPIESTGGEVLAVPLAALSAVADGSSRVQVERTPGEAEFVTVEVGLSAGGFAEVTPLDGSLDVGDQVVVGRQ